MVDYRTRYRLQGRDKPHSAWAEWGLFMLAVILGAALLLMLARPILSIPQPLPSARAPHQTDASGGATDAKPPKSS
jgi:hypothetical protein